MAKSKNYGILCIILSAFCFACMNLFVKKAGNLPSFEKSFFRNIIAFFFAFGVIVKSKEKVNIPKEALPALFMRSIGGTVGILCNFYAIDHLVIADASMLNKLSPFFVLIFSYLILKEKVKLYQGICIIVAFIGSLFVIKPTADIIHNPASLMGMLGGLGAGIAYTFVRIAGKKGVKSPVIVAFFSGFSSLVTLPLMIMDFEPMTAAQLMFLILAGLAAQAVAAILPLAVQIIEAGVFFRAKEKIGFAGKNQPEQTLVAGVKPVDEKLVHLRSLLTGRSPHSG